MIALRKTYFWKFLDTCDPVRLEKAAEGLRSAVSEVMGHEYSGVQPDSSGREIIRRWSEGCFNGPGEQSLKFLRVFYVFRWLSGSTDDRWIADIFFTRIPHIRGIYCNRNNKHIIGRAEEQKLSARLVESSLVDVFIRDHDKNLVGNAAGVYVFHKLHKIAALKGYAETSRYTPQDLT